MRPCRQARIPEGVGLTPHATTDIRVFAKHHPQARLFGLRAVSPKQLGRLAYADWHKAFWGCATPATGVGLNPCSCSPSFCRTPCAEALDETTPPFGRQIGPKVQGAGSTRQPARVWVRRQRLSYMLLPSTAVRIVDQVFARRCHASLAERRKAAEPPNEGPEGRESELRRCHRPVRMVTSATSSGSTLQGVAEKALPSGARRCFQPLVRKGVGLDSSAAGHVGHRTTKATLLIYFDGGGRCRDSFVDRIKAS